MTQADACPYGHRALMFSLWSAQPLHAAAGVAAFLTTQDALPAIAESPSLGRHFMMRT